MAEPVKVRRLTDQEGQRLQQIVRRGSTSSVRYRRAMMLLASAGGNRVPVIAQLVAADEDTVRNVIHRFNEIGLACLDPQWAGGRPRQLSPEDEDFVVQTATTRPAKLAQPLTRWSIRKLAAYLRRIHGRVIRIGREALRCLLARRGITFQRTKTWKESTDPDRDAKLDRIEHVLDHFPDRVFAFDEFGPLGIRPTGGSCWAEQGRPNRVPATYHRTHGVTYFHGCYSIGDDSLWGVNRRRKGAVNSLAALRSIRAARPDGAPIYVIMDNLSAHKGAKIRRWAWKNNVELCFTPTNASWANPIEAHFGPLRQFTLANSNHPNHTVQTRELHRYLRWRNANARHPDVLAHLHFTPTGSSWLNLVERWFAELTNKQIRRGVHRSVQALEKDIRNWIAAWNADPNPYVWTKSADEILERLASYLNRIPDSEH
ncbi:MULTISPECIES: IS630 family transposase [unclassified Streptomyces]|uniref:IS630 family transposase n=1 Tax=unclassified Streptomyces TaxID=2593676 RepID=UPI000A88ABB9|nr:IS630 family transposase [Streptomyces sp. TSRI0281]